MAQKAKYESKGTKARPMVSKKKELPKLSAFAQEFHPNEHAISESLEFQDFPLPSDDYMSYDYNPYLTSEQYGGEYESDRKPQRDSDKLEGLDFTTFVVFSNVKNVPLEMTLAEPGDGPARLRLCTFGYNCIRKTFDCPYTHIPNDEGNWHYQDENVPTPIDECDESDTQAPRKVHPKLPAKKNIGPSKPSQLPASISFVSTTSISTVSTTSDDSSVDSFDHSPSITPPDSPSASSSYSSSSDSPDVSRQDRKSKLIPTGTSSKSTVGTRKATNKTPRGKIPTNNNPKYQYSKSRSQTTHK